MKILCKSPKTASLSHLFEDSFIEFFQSSFKSSEIYIISPWISVIEFKERKFVYYPYVSSQSFIDIFKALAEQGKKIYIVSRCLDFIDNNTLFLSYNIARSKAVIPEDMRRNLRDEIRDLINRFNLILNILRLNVATMRFDVEQRLHSKIYLNDFIVMIGSLNFTYNAMYRNYECLSIIYKDEAPNIYEYSREYAKELTGSFKDFQECEDTILYNLSKIVGLRFSSLEELIEFLREDILRRL
jgi:phosphatidylserine/phosphatidylglycerophosphate/cardiolipin synthase-like enzyme